MLLKAGNAITPPCHETGCTWAFTPEGAVLGHSPLLLRFLLMSRVPAELLPSSGTSTKSAVCRDRNSKRDRVSKKKRPMKWNKTTARVFGKCSTWVMSEQSRVSLMGWKETLDLVVHNTYLLHREQWKPRKKLQTKFGVWSRKDFCSTK